MELDAGPSFNSVIDQAFLKAWRDARNASHGSPTLLIPKEKTFMLQPVLFRGRCKPPIVHIKIQEKSAYLDNPDALKKKKKKKTTFMPRREKRTLQNEAAEDQNQAQEEDTDAGCTGSQKKSRGRRKARHEGRTKRNSNPEGIALSEN
ncbi:hypothetical protein JHK86_000818 [Glycine max]|nr:hypothetical protein JHK86_000818 [Glycine max]